MYKASIQCWFYIGPMVARLLSLLSSPTKKIVVKVRPPSDSANERLSKIVRNSVFDCNLSPFWRQIAIKNSVFLSSAYFTEVKWSISKVQEGVQHFPGGPNFFQGWSNCLFHIDTHITCHFPGGSRPPVLPLNPHLTLVITYAYWVHTVCLITYAYIIQYMQQTTEADYIFRGIFFAGALTENTELKSYGKQNKNNFNDFKQ